MRNSTKIRRFFSEDDMMENTFYDYGKPQGKKGEDLLDLMDEGHTPVSLWALTNLEVKDDNVVLDIDCGSGLNIKRLHEKSSNEKTYGVDHSDVSVKKSIMMNQKEVDEGNVVIKQANVLDMPFEDETFDIITGFETVYFWPDIVNAFREVKRILKNDGKFFLVLEANGCANDQTSQTANSQGCYFYTDEELKQLLLDAGYTQITFFLRDRINNKKIIRKVTPTDCSEDVVEDIFEMDKYAEEEQSEDYTPSKEWMCIIAQK